MSSWAAEHADYFFSFIRVSITFIYLQDIKAAGCPVRSMVATALRHHSWGWVVGVDSAKNTIVCNECNGCMHTVASQCVRVCGHAETRHQLPLSQVRSCSVRGFHGVMCK